MTFVKRKCLKFLTLSNSQAVSRKQASSVTNMVSIEVSNKMCAGRSDLSKSKAYCFKASFLDSWQTWATVGGTRFDVKSWPSHETTILRGPGWLYSQMRMRSSAGRSWKMAIVMMRGRCEVGEFDGSVIAIVVVSDHPSHTVCTETSASLLLAETRLQSFLTPSFTLLPDISLLINHLLLFPAPKCHVRVLDTLFSRKTLQFFAHLGSSSSS